MIACYPPSEIAAYLAAYGRRTGPGAPDDARDAIPDYSEDRADLEHAEQWLAELKVGGRDCVPLDELLERYT